MMMRMIRCGLAGVVCAAVVVVACGARNDRPRRDAEWARRMSKRFFERNDKNKDGKVSRDEVPLQNRRMFDRVDVNRDGSITPAEDVAFRTAQAKRSGGRPSRPRPPAPDHANVKYGPHERNVFDIWLAGLSGDAVQVSGAGTTPERSVSPVREDDSRTPVRRPAITPLVIYYHGGGFRGGDKRSINAALLKKLLAGGVSVAAANYRLTNTAPFPAQMHDCARALQFIRHNAARYNIDPKRVGATGGSAGAGISQWLAFHDDLARPKSDDPVARQSTRISVAVVNAAQSSYDPRFIMKLFNTTKVERALIAFYGMKGPEDVKDPKFHALFEEASPINHASAGDAPVMLYYPQANTPLPPNSDGGRHIHHPKFGIVLKKKLDGLGIECVLLLRRDHPKGMPIDKQTAFFFKHLGVKAN